MHEDLNQLLALIERGCDGRRVLVVGDVMVDKYVYGHVERISPEAPVPVVRALRNSERPGGAANVAMNLVGLGAVPVLVGFSGEDADQALLIRLLSQSGIESNLIAVPGISTTSKLRIMGGQQQIVRLDVETSTDLPDEAYTSLIEIVERELPSVSVVILSDYAKGVLRPDICQRIIVRSRELGIPVLVDPKARDFSRYRGATTICPNLGELAAALGQAVSDVDADDLLLRARSMVGELGLQYLTVTMSERGIAVLWADHSENAPARARQVFDVSGAGDTVIAALAVCVAARIPVAAAIRLANLAAGIVVGKVGTVSIDRLELLAALNEVGRTGSEDKICSLPVLLKRAAEWRSRGETIVFTNGCFDLVHVGHVSLMESCKRLGARLVVGINSDASIASLKGPSRPVIGERDRASLLAALSATDAIVIFDDLTPVQLISALRPDLLVKGGDYTEATVVGADLVSAWGGKVHIVPLVAGFSTSELVRRAAHSASTELRNSEVDPA